MDPKPQQCAQAILDNLNAIRGDGGATYWYTPRAVRADAGDSRLLDTSIEGSIYALTLDHKEEKRATNDGPGCIIDARAFFVLTLLAQNKTPTTSPFTNTGIEKQVLQERMCQDVRKKLRADPSLGGISVDLLLSESEESPDDTDVAGWALAFMQVMVRYHYDKATP